MATQVNTEVTPLPDTNEVKGLLACDYVDNGWRVDSKDAAVEEAARIRNEENRGAKYIRIYERKDEALYGMMVGPEGSGRAANPMRKLMDRVKKVAENKAVMDALAQLEKAIDEAEAE